MKNIELRIGNYLQDAKGKLAPVEGLSKNKIKAYSGMVTEMPLKPIPLTEEWLLKFGFYTDNEGWYYSLDFDKNQDTFKICPLYSNGIPSGMFSVLNCMACVKKIQFVHQLQNLYFALTGEELTINK